MTSESKVIGNYIKLKDSGEIKINSEILEDLYRHFCSVTKCDTFDKSKIRVKSKKLIKTPDSYFPDIFSIPINIVERWIRFLNLNSVPGLNSKLDLDKGKYEGGFKVWESTNDLVDFLIKDDIFIGQLLRRDDNLRVLELGAGAALPSLALIGRLIKDLDFQSNYTFHIQDYNWQVLISLTLMNFAANLPEDFLKALIDTRCLRYFYGDWKHFKKNSKTKYELIMMSEAIYNSDSYGPLYELLVNHLKPDGYVVIATKDTYFGLSGGLYSWIEYLEVKRHLVPCKIVQTSTTNIPRSILILRKRQHRTDLVSSIPSNSQ